LSPDDMKSPRPGVLLLAFFLALGACARPMATDPVGAGVEAAREGRWDEAARHWRLALEQDPGSAAGYNNLAVVLERQGAYDEARRAYEAALRLDPENPAIKGNYEAFRRRMEKGRGRRP